MKKFVDNVLSQVSEKLAVYVRRAGIGDAAKLINLNIAFRCLMNFDLWSISVLTFWFADVKWLSGNQVFLRQISNLHTRS